MYEIVKNYKDGRVHILLYTPEVEKLPVELFEIYSTAEYTGLDGITTNYILVKDSDSEELVFVVKEEEISGGGGSSSIKTTIDDTKVSNKTTYSSSKIEEKIEKNKNQYCYTHGCKFEVEKHFNIFNLNRLKPGNSFSSIYWPWIIRVDDKLDNPLGKYYLYYSTDHANTTGGIGLAYSNNILDGFTDYGKIYQNENKETETPSVIYDYENKKFIIYFHSLGTYEGENQTSWSILSDDGINFDSSTLKKAFDLNHNELIGDLHNGYLHPFNIGDTYYAYSLMGGGDNCTSAFHISKDGGYTWKTDYKQIGAWGYNPENNTLLNPYHGTVIQKYGIFWWVGSRTNFTSGSNPKTIASIDIVPLNDFTHPAAKSSVLISMDNEEYESKNIRQCTCFYDEGNIYILYQCDNIFNCAILK